MNFTKLMHFISVHSHRSRYALNFSMNCNFVLCAGIKTCLGAQKNRLIETILLSTNNICFSRDIRKLIQELPPLIWWPV